MKSRNAIAAFQRKRRRILFAALLLLLALGGAGYYVRKEMIARREARAITAALDEGRTGDAAVGLEHWLQRSPDSGQAHFLMARLAWIKGNLPAVEREVDRAEDLGYSEQPLWRLKGLLLSRGTEKTRAEALLLRELDASHGADREVAETLVNMYLESFRLRDATAVLYQWAKAAPRDARPYMLQAEIDQRVEATAETIIERYQEALARDGSLDAARLGLAKQFHRSHRFAEAAAEYAKYLDRQPADALGYLGAGQNALEMGDDNAAAPLLDRALALAPRDSEVLAACATLELHRGRLERALSLFDQAIAADPFDHWNCYQRMLILSRLGRKAEADVERQRVARLKSDGDRFSDLSRELVRNPLDSKLRGEAATWLMEHGHEDEAVDWANLVLQKDPTHFGMNRLLADHFRKKGQTGLANFYESQMRRPQGEVSAN